MRFFIQLMLISLVMISSAGHAEMLNDDTSLKEGMRYFNGDGVDVDTFKAAKCFERSGNGIAYFMLSRMYSNDDEDIAKYVLPPNKALAETYMRKALSALQTAAADSDPSAQTYLGNMFYYGIGVKEDKLKGLVLIRQAADSGYSKAWRLLGNITIEDKLDEAYGYFEKAVSLGDRESEGGLVRINERKYIDTADPSYKETIKKMANEGSPFAMVSLAIDEKHLGKYTHAMSLFKKASQDDLGSTKAMAFSFIALMYHRGEGVEESRAMSLKYLNEACRHDVYECYNRDLYKDGKETWP
ncbi:sel1 repeat family protein [Pseudomonas sp. PDM18]|uniref:tetratricopeptide repeat protein n=1 Tax=Pseudomonas sp. PDM18 TaxID=2769253 RepID=UPI00177C3494|nr:tetratricopeptide repeat protein [Pseudomonas sp. PDM18]MBD9680325.1 sel1 repeat family protein [Pseudomonas sp. PDM18]